MYEDRSLSFVQDCVPVCDGDIWSCRDVRVPRGKTRSLQEVGVVPACGVREQNQLVQADWAT